MSGAAASDFRRATFEEQAQRLARLARRALGAWSFEDAELELIKYRENAVFGVTTGEGERFVMRVHRPDYRTDAQILSEIHWMSALSESGIRTPEPALTSSGDMLCSVAADGVPEPRQCDLFRWISGSPVGTLEHGIGGDREHAQRTYELVGEIAARVHDHGRSWKPSDAFTRPPWDADALVGDDPTFGRFWELDVLSEDQLRVLLQARDATRAKLEAFGQSDDRYGLLHGDLLPENILVDADGPQLIDFDDCGDGWYGFELATGLFPMLTQPLFDDVLAAYVEGYRRVRAFPNESLELLPTFMMARALSYLGWPVGRPEMHEERKLAAFLAQAVTSLAEVYVAGAA